MRVDKPDLTVLTSKDDFILHNQQLETRIEKLEEALGILANFIHADQRDKLLEAIKDK